MKRSLLTLLVIAAIGCQKGSDVSGLWHIEQDGAGFGEGAEKTELNLGGDGKFTMTLGPVNLASGDWKFADSKLSLSNAGANMGTDYRLDNGKLIPIINGKDVSFWRFVRK